jgi:hypothetical protein
MENVKEKIRAALKRDRQSSIAWRFNITTYLITDDLWCTVNKAMRVDAEAMARAVGNGCRKITVT